MSLVADLGGAVDLHQVVLVHQVLQDEVEQPWDILQLVPAVYNRMFPTEGSDDGTVEGVHHGQ